MSKSPRCKCCKLQPPVPERLNCQKCLEARATRDRAYYDKMVEARVCVRCLRPLTTTTRVRCESCRRRHNTKTIAAYRRRRAAGTCGWCDSPPLPDKACCARHALVGNTAGARWRKNQKATQPRTE